MKKFKHHFLFNKQNFMLMGGGIGLMVLGFLLLQGGGYTDLNTPNYDAKYSFTRTVLAPFLVLLGLGVNGYAIMKKPSSEEVQHVLDNVYQDKSSTKARTASASKIRSKDKVVTEKESLEVSKQSLKKRKKKKS